MSDVDRRLVLGVAGLAGVAAISRLAKGGPVNPPQGPVMPSGRSLMEVEPRTPVNNLVGSADAVHVITGPGTYYLTADIVVPAGKHGILVAAGSGGVAIDLKGFTIHGDGSLATGSGITAATPGPAYLEICDGFIRDLDGDGIRAGGAHIVEAYDLHINHCLRGIVIDRDSGIVESCTIERCAADGMLWDKQPGSAPVFLIVDDCEFRTCGGNGLAIRGDWSADNGTLWISECDASANLLDGFHMTMVVATSGVVLQGQISDCAATGNGRIGSRMSVAAQPGTAADLCILQIADVACTSNALGGMRLFNLHADVLDCDCSRNQADGFTIQAVEGSVDGCVASRNAGNGFSFSSSCRVSVCDLAAHRNASVGIHLDQSSRGISVTECDCQSNATGYQVDGSGNLLLWNTASGNATNYAVDPAANPIIILTPNDLAAIHNPHANYSL